MDDTKKTNTLFIIYLLEFLFTLHYTLPVYINSTFLSGFTTERLVGLLYAISAVITILLFIKVPAMLRRFGNYPTTLVLLFIELFSLVGLAYFKEPLLISLAFILSFAAVAILNFNLDIYLEDLSTDGRTGKLRGIFLTSGNAAWIVGPLLASLILTDGDYWKVYLIAASLLVPVILLLRGDLKKVPDPEYRRIPIRETLPQILGNIDLYRTFWVSFLLQFFYCWMVIYAPIYLYTYVGFSWAEIGLIFGIMLLPFVLTEAPLGWLADNRFGEKEIMSIGFIIMAVATAAIPFIQTKSIALWAAVFFMSRIGASMVEVMSETYFFKHVNAADTNVIGLFRTMRPWAYLLSPVLATILFLFIPINFIFIVLGFCMFYGLRYSLALKDTR